MWEYHYGFGWWFVFGGVMMLLFWAGIIAAVVLLIRTLFGRGRESPSRGRETPLEIAARRLASGEITEDEYNRIKSTLER